MKLKLDENIPVSVKHLLVNVSKEIHSVYDEDLAGVKDAVLWEACQLEKRFLITQDLDFSDIRRFSPGTHHGILLLRLKNPSSMAIKSLVSELVNKYCFEDWRKCVVVASQNKVRVFKTLSHY